MRHIWIVNLQHYLGHSGNIAPLSPRALRLARYWTEIVSQATLYDETTTLRCRRRPKPRPCRTPLTIFFDVDNDDVLWFCPICYEEGRISVWQNTFWDHGDLLEIRS